MNRLFSSGSGSIGWVLFFPEPGTFLIFPIWFLGP